MTSVCMSFDTCSSGLRGVMQANFIRASPTVIGAATRPTGVVPYCDLTNLMNAEKFVFNCECQTNNE